jgi:hypothetical protein
MWKLLLAMSEDVQAQSRRKGGLKPEPAGAPALAIATYLERTGKSLDLVCKMILADAQTNGEPLVTSHDRQTAAELIMLLLSDKGQREAYEQFLRIAVPEFRHTTVPDDLTANFIFERRWSQLSSGLLGKLLLNPTAIAHLSKKLAAEAPAAWADLLPARSARPPREAVSAGPKRKPVRKAK